MIDFIKEYRDFSLITVANLFFQCGFTSFFLLPLFIRDMGGDMAYVGYVMGIFGVASVGTAPFAGLLINRYGQKIFMLGGSVLMFVAYLVHIFITDTGISLLVLRLVQGIAFGFFFTAASTAVAYSVPRKIRHSCLTTFSLTTIACFAIGPFFGEIIISKISYKMFFVYAALFNVVAFIFCFFSNEVKFLVTHANPFSGFFNIIKSERFRVLIFMNMMTGAALGALVHFFHLFLNDKGLQMGVFFVIFAATAVLIRIMGGNILNITERRKIALPSIVLMAIAIIIAFSVDSFSHLVLFSILFSLGYSFTYPTISTMFIDRTTAGERGTAMGIFNMAYGTGINSCAIILGLILRDYGFLVMYISAGMFLIFGCVIFIYKYFISIEEEEPVFE